MLPRLVIAGLAAFSCLAQPALAEDQILYADCGEAGCTCRLSPVTLVEYELVTGSPPPPDAETMVLVSYGGDLIWSRSSVDEIDLAAGGDGTCEIELFPIVPQDGTWSGTVRVRNVQGCLPQVAETVPPLVDGTSATKQIAWGGTFHPRHLVMGTAPERFRWTQRSSTRFDGDFPVPPNGTLDVSVTATATLTAPDRAEARLALRLSAAPGADAGALAALGMADCRVDAIYDFARVGP